MTRMLLTVRLVLALTMVGLCASLLSLTGGPAAAVTATGDTPLPAGWELCVLQGINGPATQANVNDLDAWQAQEGGSTNNTAAYNPYNTRRTTDFTNQPLPEVQSSNGFPAFANWQAGCAATTATLLQMNMWVITAALRAGNVSPPAAFLATVDQSQWCAPSSDGQPCYLNAIVGSAGTLATPLVDTASALDVYTNVKTDLHAYEVSVLQTGLDQNVLVARDWELVSARTGVSTSRDRFTAAKKALRQFALQEYENSGLFEANAFLGGVNKLTPTGPQTANGVVAHQYETVIAADLVGRYQAADQAIAASVNQRVAATRAVAQEKAKLALDDTAEDKSLARLVDDVSTLQQAGACTTATLVSSPAPSATAQSNTSTSTTTTTTTAPASTPTTTAPTSTTTSTSTTTTTIVRTATVPTVPSLPVPTTAPTTSTTTTTTTLPPTTTTTTTVPLTPTSGPPPAVNTAGLGVLQGCMAALAPSGSA
jgi:hypothetical protein